MKKKYLAISKAHFIDQETFKIVTKSKLHTPNIIFYPFYFPSLNTKVESGLSVKDGVLGNSYNIQEYVDTLSLNQLKIQSLSKGKYVISFYDNRREERHKIKIQEGMSYFKVGSPESTYTIPLTISFDSDENTTEFNYVCEDVCNHMYAIQNLIHKDLNNSKSFKCTVNIGLLGSQFNIKYKGKVLDGTCYVYLNKQWGIILQDDLSLDALFLVRGQKGNTIEVDRFLYTSNAYVIKCITLLK